MNRIRIKGFTLLEVVISMMIISVVTGEVLLLITASQKAGILAGKRLQAYNLAMEQKELLRAKAVGFGINSSDNWDSYLKFLTAENNDVNDKCMGLDIDSIILNNAEVDCEKTVDKTKYTIKLDILIARPDNVDASEAGKYRKIDITVSWPSYKRTGLTESVTMNYYITKDRYIGGEGI